MPTFATAAGARRCQRATLMHRCFSGKYTQQEMEALLHSGSEFYSYLGTNDLAEV